MVRDFTSIGTKPKSLVRRRINDLLMKVMIDCEGEARADEASGCIKNGDKHKGCPVNCNAYSWDGKCQHTYKRT